MFRSTFIALALILSLHAQTPTAPDPYRQAIFDGMDADKKGLLGRALEHYRDAQKLDPKRLDAYFYQGQILTRQHKGEEAITAFTKVIELDPKASTAYQLRGLERFKLGQIDKSIRDFDLYLSLEPQQEPYHWQRGIALYYAGRYEDGAKQFEKHRTVNSDDVENPAWHFLCVARAESFEKAREKLLPVDIDRRVPMMQIYNLLAGKGTEEDVMKAVTEGNPSAVQLDSRNFYAHLYLGLYYEAKGDAKQAYDHIKRAATDYPADHYMGDVAKLHFKRLLENPPKK